MDQLRTFSADLSLTFQDTLCSSDDLRPPSNSHAISCLTPLHVWFCALSSRPAGENYSLFSQRPSLGHFSLVARQPIFPPLRCLEVACIEQLATVAMVGHHCLIITKCLLWIAYHILWHIFYLISLPIPCDAFMALYI